MFYIYLIDMLDNLSLFLNLKRSSLQFIGITRIIRLLIRERHQVRRIREEIVHLLEWKVLGFWQDKVEEHSICKVTYDEKEVVLVTEVCHSDVSNLSNHGVEREGNHGGDGDTLRARLCVEDLSRNDPGERPASCREGEVVSPSTNDKPPRGPFVACYPRRKLCDQYTCDEEAKLQSR
jgi:hypothetical protein